MPRGKDISKEKIFEIVHLHENGKSARSIAETLGINRDTANRLIKRKSEVKNGNFNCERKGVVGANQFSLQIRRRNLFYLMSPHHKKFLVLFYNNWPEFLVM